LQKTQNAIKDLKSDGENFTPNTPFHSEALAVGSRVAKAIQKVAVVVGCGRHQRTVPEISWS